LSNGSPCRTTSSWRVTPPTPVARHSGRGWRIDKPNPRANIGSMIALAMAVERAEQKPEPVELLGWL
jgi:hypothetical protein